MIKVNDLYKSFSGVSVLNGISEEIDEGEVVVVIGPSGSGKSTFLRCLNLLETPDSGEVIIDGEQINNIFAKGVFRHLGIKPLPGDTVYLREDENGYMISGVEKRKNSFIRPAVANLDIL